MPMQTLPRTRTQPAGRERAGARWSWLAAVLLALAQALPQLAGAQSLAFRSGPGADGGSPDMAAFRLTSVYQRNAEALDSVVDVRLDDVRREDALRRIAALGGFRVAFSRDLVALDDRLTLHLDGVTILEAMQEATRGADLSLQLSLRGQFIVGRRVTPLPVAEAGRPFEVSLQTGTVEGRVTDAQTGDALPGVNIAVVGTLFGAATETDGRYSIAGLDPGTYDLQASFIGYEPQTAQGVVVRTDEVTVVDFQLQSATTEFDEVVVVGYGTQRKVSLTGAVESLEGAELEKRPVASMSQALQGKAPGLTVRVRGGRPGADGAELRIRGVGTIGDANPLVLVDGVPGDINDIDMNDVADVSVLKDAASAAIYGARAANGVILITTKRGERDGRLTISYDGYVGQQNVVALPERVGIGDYIHLINEAYTNAGLEPKYSDEYIQNSVAGTDRVRYPDTDWMDVLWDPALQMDHSLRFSGGTDLAAFALSLNVLDQDGMIPNTGAERQSLRLNTDFGVSERLKAGVDVALTREENAEPSDVGGVLFRMFHDTPPMTMAKYPDGSYGISDNGRNPLAAAELGRRTRKTDYGLVHLKGSYEILSGLRLMANASVQATAFSDENFREEYTFRDYFTKDVKRTWTPNWMDETKSNRTEVELRAMLDYDRTFGRHYVHGLFGYDQIANDWDEVGAGRDRFYNNELREIVVGDASVDDTWGRSESWRLRSWFGRLNYTWKDRYLFEANARYDGSSRFAEGRRYGFFPSFSAGWRISEERFMSRLGFVSNLKLRGSWGRLGNQNIQFDNRQLYYPYWSTIDLSQNYSFGGVLVTGAAPVNYANEEISWETTTMTDVGLDVSFFNGRLSFTGDLYWKETEGILLTLPIPLVVGLGAPVQNAGVVRNNGWEAALSYRDGAGDLFYGMAFNLSDVHNEIVDLAGTGPYVNGLWIQQVGHEIGAIYGYESAGLFQSQAEVDAWATQHTLTGPGDIKYVDQNGDGIVNGDDRVVIGSDLPHYTFGATFDLAWKGFDASVFLQGVLKANAYAVGALTEGPVWENYTTKEMLDRWTPDNPDATFPKPTIRTTHNQQASDYWLQDARYLKLKNVQIGFTLPGQLAQRLRAQRVRLYVTGSNLFTWTKMKYTLDPEFPSGRVDYYPQTRLLTAGVNLQF